jgi:hypothetical protein
MQVAAETHSCQQPAAVVDHVAGKVFLLSSIDNWHMVVQESVDRGASWTPWAEARNLDAELRMPGWGCVFAGLPGGLQLRAPNPHAGRLVVCSSVYWTGGETDKDGRIVKKGDDLSRYSYTILSDDHGATVRVCVRVCVLSLFISFLPTWCISPFLFLSPRIVHCVVV